MHELSICQALLRQVQTIAAQHQATAVHKIYLQIGALSGVEAELLSQAFSIAKAQSIAATAELIITTAPIMVKCKQCNAQTIATANRLLCADCGSWHTQLISGDELLLSSLELSTD